MFPFSTILFADCTHGGEKGVKKAVAERMGSVQNMNCLRIIQITLEQELHKKMVTKMSSTQANYWIYLVQVRGLFDGGLVVVELVGVITMI